MSSILMQPSIVSISMADSHLDTGIDGPQLTCNSPRQLE
ncbi:hypothetical protein OH687_28210 [Burkholderia anthina]|nr:hypothetical protein OH687_28210 [Burkholderia anthina]